MSNKPDVTKIIAAIKKTKGNRKHCYNLPEHMSDYAGSIVGWLKATTPVKIDALVEHIEELQRKVEALEEEIARRDAMFIPLYPDENLMNQLTDVFNDTVQIDYEDGGVRNQELVINAIINNYIKSGAAIADIEARGVEQLVKALAVIANSEEIDGDTVVCDFSTLVSVAAGALREHYAQQKRLEHANELIKIISAHGRRFFFDQYSGRVAQLIIGKRGRIWLADEYTGRLIYTHKTTWTNKWRGFSHGGTLRGLVEMMRDYIVTGRPIPAYCLGPERHQLTDGNIWGYAPDAMQAVRDAAEKLPIIDGGIND